MNDSPSAQRATMPYHGALPLREWADDVWAKQVGPAYSSEAVADLLGISQENVAKCQGLLALQQRSGDSVYPAFQFEGGRAPHGGAR